ncbi:ABC transporter, solute-binding protein family 3 [Desulfonema limicola]|uniref:ABC transporter, solute-binding protein family 3 n=1 Tax=Desulfonema limicola TaxID=45656 RepID=A0A975GG86_9BACT|nr:transporter substrate-binding domain-containing protein [Desulfonema limicola]QTA80037.1 ABC transporter, solute-binding protein family 3 [Desulfonema limicola]
MKNKWLYLLLFIFLIFPAAQAENIKIVTGEWAPFTSEKVEGYGFITEIVSLALKNMGIIPEYEFHKWNRCYSMVKRGDVLAAFPYSYTEERAEDVFFSDTIGKSRTMFFQYQSQLSPEIKYNILEDLKPYKIGGVKGYFYEKDFKESGLNVSYTSDETSALKKLEAGRIDLLPLNEIVGWELIKKHYPEKINKFKTLEKPYNVDNLMLIVSRKFPGSSNFLNNFNNSLNQIKTKNEYSGILIKYRLNND